MKNNFKLGNPIGKYLLFPHRSRSPHWECVTKKLLTETISISLHRSLYYSIKDQNSVFAYILLRHLRRIK